MSIGQRVFSDFVRAFCCYHFFQKFFIGLGAALHHLAVLEPQLDAGDFVAVAVERLVNAEPTVGATPVRRGENFKGWNVATRTRVPRTLFSEGVPNIHVFAHRMQAVNLRRELVEPAAVFLDITIYALPFGDWVFLIEE